MKDCGNFMISKYFFKGRLTKFCATNICTEKINQSALRVVQVRLVSPNMNLIFGRSTCVGKGCLKTRLF